MNVSAYFVNNNCISSGILTLHIQKYKVLCYLDIGISNYILADSYSEAFRGGGGLQETTMKVIVIKFTRLNKHERQLNRTTPAPSMTICYFPVN